jgi:hypothetical protein
MDFFPEHRIGPALKRKERIVSRKNRGAWLMDDDAGASFAIESAG